MRTCSAERVRILRKHADHITIADDGKRIVGPVLVLADHHAGLAGDAGA
jgi:hypothetical protein